MGLASALANSGELRGPLATALIATGAGGLFCAMGVILFTNYRGLARKWVQVTDESLEQIPPISKPLRRFNVRVFFAGNGAAFAEHKLNVMPKIVGAGFVLLGTVAFVTGVVRLLMLA